MKTSKFLFAVAVSLFAFASCQKEVAPETENGEKTVKFVAQSIETKTAFGTKEGSSYPTLWTENDSKVKISLNYATPKDATVTPAADYKTATFEAELADDKSESYTFYSLSPSTAYTGISKDYKSVTITIPNVQTPTTSSVDEAAQILAAKSSTLNTWPSEVAFDYSHVTAYGKMSISNLNLGSATITSIALTAEDNWAGRWYYYPESGQVAANSASKTITLNITSVSDIWFACAPVDLGGKKITVTINTTAGPFEKEITWPAGKAFTSGKVYKFAVDMTGITPGGTKTYTKVTDKNQITVDSELIIVANDASVAMSTTQNTNNRAVASVDKTGNTIANPGANVQVFKAKAGNISNTISFYTGTSYIYAAGGGNILKSQAELDDKASFTLEIEDGKALLVAQDKEITQNIIRYNLNSGGSPMFSCYSSSSSVQGEVCIYKLNGSGTSTVIFLPELAKPVISNVSSDHKNVTVTWTDVANATAYTVTCGTESVNVNSGVQTATLTMSEYGEYSITVTAKANGYAPAQSNSYKYNLVDPDASELTISFAPSDFSGGTSGTGSPVSKTKAPITVSSDKAFATTQLRVYSGAKLTISSDVGNIKSIAFTYSGSYTGGLSTKYDNLDAKEIVFSCTSQARITGITVVYSVK